MKIVSREGNVCRQQGETQHLLSSPSNRQTTNRGEDDLVMSTTSRRQLSSRAPPLCGVMVPAIAGISFFIVAVLLVSQLPPSGDRITRIATPTMDAAKIPWIPPNNEMGTTSFEASVKAAPPRFDGQRVHSNRPSSLLHVPTDLDGFPSFLTYSTSGAPINVSFDGRSLMLNSERAIFLAGSLHPVRATPATWEMALDQAVQHGLNMITLYVMWAAHQPFRHQPLDWRFPSASVDLLQPHHQEWTVASAIQAAAARGLFVHIRLGPYVCAEYNYGGIPEWVPLQYPDMDLRRPNAQWLTVMQDFITAAVHYLESHQLWAYQGGPIVLAQIENELQQDDSDVVEEDESSLPDVNGVEWNDSNRDHSVRNATLQDYANWCGHLAHSVAPQVVWTMCNGLTAPNTIETFNGDTYGASWLEYQGQSGNIQVSHPALWTEDEGGFQIWGDEPTHPSDYFWGRTARGMAYNALQWFARGGTHLNYYMWWGGYNRGRSAAAGIMNQYGADAPLCPSGERRQPKYDHFQALHAALIEAAPILLHCPTALRNNQSIEMMNDNGDWELGESQVMYRYVTTTRPYREATFVENNIDESRLVRLFLQNHDEHIFEMQPYSAVLFLDGIMRFDSAALPKTSQNYCRSFQEDPSGPLNWISWQAPVGASLDRRETHRQYSSQPLEQTAILVNSNMSSDYVWYEVSFNASCEFLDEPVTLLVATQQSNALIVYLDDELVGHNESHRHAEGNVTLSIALSATIRKGSHRLAILSESFGHDNVIGCFGVQNTRAKKKGITGSVILFSHRCRIDLTDGGCIWRMHAGLHGEHQNSAMKQTTSAIASGRQMEDLTPMRFPVSGDGGSWSLTRFDTPQYDPLSHSLFVDIMQGRGHLWLNGIDLGRYWNITRGETQVLSQQYYFLPPDLLYHNGSLNELLLFDSFGGVQRPHLVLSWVAPSDKSQFADEVGFFPACL